MMRGGAYHKSDEIVVQCRTKDEEEKKRKIVEDGLVADPTYRLGRKASVFRHWLGFVIRAVCVV